MVRSQVFEDQGTLDGITGGTHLRRHEEDSADTDITSDARPVGPLHEELDPKARCPTPVRPTPRHGPKTSAVWMAHGYTILLGWREEANILLTPCLYA